MADEDPILDEHTLNIQIGRSVALALRARGMPAKALAPKVGLTEATLSARINGHTPFKAHELVWAAQALDVPVATFYRDPSELLTGLLAGFLSGYVTAVPDPEGPLQLSLDDALDAAKLPSPTLCLI